ncbi:MAG: DUF2029 domain-containing protein [Oscillatoriales cyanobacterium C42_A2020_001]|nr:DUF2029 domain-containing protein [Leptolyngbyaceae cyanobacterium C42_A2020_001]
MSLIGHSVSPYIVYLSYFFLILVGLGVNILGRRRFGCEWNLQLGVKVSAILIGLFIFIFGAPINFFSDFMVAYYPAGRLVLENPYGLYNLNVVFVNIPIIALIFIPFSFVSPHFAIALLVIVTSLIAILSYRLLSSFSKVTGWKMLALFSLFSISGPLIYSFKEGNSTHFVLPLILIALLLLHRSQRVHPTFAMSISA